MESNIFTVSEINYRIKSLIESDFSLIGIKIRGEITSLNKHYTGHYYFKLRDDDGSILSCVMFSMYTKYVYPDLKNGDKVILTGSLNVYEKGGTYSFNTRKIEKSGLGKYLLDLIALEKKLESEGIFAKEKRKIPLKPNKIAVLTALTGAAVHDVCSSILKRCNASIRIYPCSVQGENASKTMIKALKEAYKSDNELIILTRGGGSKEDLYAFNDEELIRTIYESPVPFISAVGHSIDSSLVDKVSDLCCITPTDAGNHAIINRDDVLNDLKQKSMRLNDIMTKIITNNCVEYNDIRAKLIMYSPLNMIKEKEKHLKTCLKEMNDVISLRLFEYSTKLDYLKKNLKYPYHKLYTLNDKICSRKKELDKIILNLLYNHENSLKKYNELLESLSPRLLLLKGYGYILNDKNEIISSVKNVRVSDEIKVELSDGIIYSSIRKIEEK